MIRPDAADVYGLDYLALGHWHKRFLFKAADGAERTAYPGTHEPMGFPDGAAVAWAVKLSIPTLPPVVAALLIVGPYGLVFLGMSLALRVEGATSAIRILLRR